MTTTPNRASLTRGETHSPTKSHHPNRPLTCTVSPSLTESQFQSHTQSHSLTTLRSETMRLRDETTPTSTSSSAASAAGRCRRRHRIAGMPRDLVAERMVTRASVSACMRLFGARDHSSLPGRIDAGQRLAANGVLLAKASR